MGPGGYLKYRGDGGQCDSLKYGIVSSLYSIYRYAVYLRLIQNNIECKKNKPINLI